jgi:Ca2+-binding EF-hand superfamily protein
VLTPLPADASLSFTDFLAVVASHIPAPDSPEDIDRAWEEVAGDAEAISTATLAALASRLGVSASVAELEEMVAMMDVDGDGVINKAEFARVMNKANMM